MKNENFNAGLAYAEYKQRQLAYIIAAITAFLMSAYFVVGYFAGHLRIMEWDGSQWAQAIPSLGLVGVMTAYQFFLYSQGDVEGGKKATWIAVAVAVAFSLLSEIGQGMERDNIRMEAKSMESPTYKAIVGAIGGAAGATYNPYSADLQAAEMKLAQCQERLSRGKEKHCEGSKARVEAVNKMIANGNASSQEKALALATTAKTMERDEKNYHPLVNFIREILGASGTVASFLLSLTLISFFEYAFHYLGGEFAKAKAKLMQHGYDVTRKLRQPPRKHDGSVTTYSAGNTAPALSALDSAKMTVGEYAAKVEEGLKASPEVIANEYARAQHAREQLYKTGADKLENIQSGLNESARVNGLDMSRIGKVFNPDSEKPEIVETDGFKQSPEQRKTVDRLYQDQMKTYRQELREGKAVYYDGPLDEPRPALPKMSVEQTVKQLQADVKASGATSPEAIQAAVFDSFAAMPNPAPLDDAILQKLADKIVIKQAHAPNPAHPYHQKPGMTGLHNPALGTAEEHYPLPLSPVVNPSPRCLNSVVDNEKLTTVTTTDNGDNEKLTTAAMLKKVATLEQELASKTDEMEAKQRELDNDRQRLQANAQAKLDSEREERKRAEAARELEIRQRAETAALEAGQREAEIRQRAEEAVAAAARELEIRQREAEALATEKAERGALTDEQIDLATAVIRTAITEGHIQKVGTPQVSPILKAAGLPTGAPVQRVLHKLACKQLETEGLVIQNPNKANGQPLYLIA